MLAGLTGPMLGSALDGDEGGADVGCAAHAASQSAVIKQTMSCRTGP